MTYSNLQDIYKYNSTSIETQIKYLIIIHVNFQFFTKDKYIDTLQVANITTY